MERPIVAEPGPALAVDLSPRQSRRTASDVQRPRSGRGGELQLDRRPELADRQTGQLGLRHIDLGTGAERVAEGAADPEIAEADDVVRDVGGEAQRSLQRRVVDPEVEPEPTRSGVWPSAGVVPQR